MKKIILLSALVFFTFAGGLRSQVINPIPSYNFHLTEIQALFGEIRVIPVTTKEKRDMVVEISTASHGAIPIFARVWVVKKNGNIVKGPFAVSTLNRLTVPIDNGKWGVVINCVSPVFVDVWTQ